MSKLQDTTKTEIDKAKDALRHEKRQKMFEKAKPEHQSTYVGESEGESLTKVYQPPKPDLKK